MNAVVDFHQLNTSKFQQITTRFDNEFGVMWSIMHPEPRPCFNKVCLNDLLQHHTYLQNSQGQIISQGNVEQVNYLVLASSIE
ncbi:MAG: enoyl-CoA hydratase, partial [Methylotenera sp.]